MLHHSVLFFSFFLPPPRLISPHRSDASRRCHQRYATKKKTFRVATLIQIYSLFPLFHFRLIRPREASQQPPKSPFLFWSSPHEAHQKDQRRSGVSGRGASIWRLLKLSVTFATYENVHWKKLKQGKEDRMNFSYLLKHLLIWRAINNLGTIMRSCQSDRRCRDVEGGVSKSLCSWFCDVTKGRDWFQWWLRA